jgi:hypothetical protein
MEIVGSALKHGINEDDIRHALRNMISYWSSDYDDEARIFLFGPDRSGQLLELVAVPTHDPQRITHADVLRPKFYDYL